MLQGYSTTVPHELIILI